MPKTILRLLLVVGFVLAAQACAPTGAATPNADVIATAIVQTLTALPPSGPGIPVTGDESPTPTITSVPTATQAVSPTSTVTSTANITPGVPQVRVSVATNCRSGPGTAYERVGVLRVGEVAEVVGRSADGNYWIIRNPDRSGQTCWLWGNYATLEGNTNTLPQMTPPPQPTPEAGFDVFYDGLERCTDTGWWVEINVENLGALTFRSIALTLEDRDTGVSLTQRTDGFRDNDGCDESEIRATLAPETSVVVSSAIFEYDPTGHRVRATITLCSETGRRGTCITETVNLTP